MGPKNKKVHHGVYIDELVRQGFCTDELVELKRIGNLSIEELKHLRASLGKLEGQKVGLEPRKANHPGSLSIIEKKDQEKPRTSPQEWSACYGVLIVEHTSNVVSL